MKKLLRFVLMLVGLMVCSNFKINLLQPALSILPTQQGEVFGVHSPLEIESQVLSVFTIADLTLSLPDLLILVDKQHAIDSSAPADLIELSPLGAPGKYIRNVTFPSLQSLFWDMKKQGLPIKILSAYRSYRTQKNLFFFYKKMFGSEAYRFSAEAGHSEHQLGTTVDFGIGNSKIDFTQKFADTPQGQWLEAHVWEYGFVESYPKDKEQITGYIYEPWHYRFIGLGVAKQWHESGLTLREFLQQNSE